MRIEVFMLKSWYYLNCKGHFYLCINQKTMHFWTFTYNFGSFRRFHRVVKCYNCVLTDAVAFLTELLHIKNKGINLHAGVFSNFNTVLLQFYAQTYSNSIQIYHCKNYITRLYFYHSIKSSLKNLC